MNCIHQDDAFHAAASLLPEPFGMSIASADRQSEAEEIRLRCSQLPAVLYPEGEHSFPQCRSPVTSDVLIRVVETATKASVHHALTQIRNGYFTIRGGHRIGICGRGVLNSSGMIGNLTEFSSLCIRIAREHPGIAESTIPELLAGGIPLSTLILSPPGGGKTTCLRDLIRSVSDGVCCCPLRVGLADERDEIAAMWQGQPQMSVGAHTDIVSGCPKSAALPLLLRGMNPELLAVDEITAPEDLAAVSAAANCGVLIFATAHAGSLEELHVRPLYRQLLKQNIFQRIVLIGRDETGQRYYHVYPVEVYR